MNGPSVAGRAVVGRRGRARCGCRNPSRSAGSASRARSIACAREPEIIGRVDHQSGAIRPLDPPAIAAGLDQGLLVIRHALVPRSIHRLHKASLGLRFRSGWPGTASFGAAFGPGHGLQPFRATTGGPARLARPPADRERRRPCAARAGRDRAGELAPRLALAAGGAGGGRDRRDPGPAGPGQAAPAADRRRHARPGGRLSHLCVRAGSVHLARRAGAGRARPGAGGGDPVVVALCLRPRRHEDRGRLFPRLPGFVERRRPLSLRGPAPAPKRAPSSSPCSS